jgi:hypothetical protein
MTPVRVVTPSGKAILPLRMVNAGTGPYVDIVLYVIADKPQGLVDLTETHVDLSQLTWSFSSGSSNYDMLRTDALGQNMGASYLTAFAMSHAFENTFPQVQVGPIGSPTALGGTLADVYFMQAALDASTPIPDCSEVNAALRTYPIYEGPTTTAADAGPSTTTDGGPLGASDAGRRPDGSPGSDAGRRSDGGLRSDAGRRFDGGPVSDSGRVSEGGSATDAAHVSGGRPDAAVPSAGGGSPNPGRFVCNGDTDIEAAMIGMHPQQVWLGRLEMNLPHEALSMDCRLQELAAPSYVSNQIRATKYSGDPCPGGQVQGLSAAASFTAFPWTVGSLAALGLSRRARSRRSRKHVK